MSIGLKFGMKKWFFDTLKVEKLIGKKAAAGLSKAGAFVRTNVRRKQLRPRKKPSMPGQPPSVHAKGEVATLRAIWFALDKRTLTIVVGPRRLNVHSLNRVGSGPGAQHVLASGTVPGTLEHGGTVGVRKIQDTKGKWVRIPFGQRRKPERLVPVWKATRAEKKIRSGVATIRKGKRAINYYRIENPPSRIFWHSIAARPFMQPAMKEEAPKFPNLIFGRAAA